MPTLNMILNIFNILKSNVIFVIMKYILYWRKLDEKNSLCH